MPHSVILWIKGLIAAIISGAANAITVAIVDPVEYLHSEHSLRKLGAVALVSGIVGAAMYLKQSPLPNGHEKQ